MMRIRNLRLLTVAAISTLLLFVQSQAATVETRNVPSKAMNKDIPSVIVVPDSYAKSQYPVAVVYLLHGFGGKQDSWVKGAPVEELADRFNVIVVCPDGADSWYFDIPTDPNYRYETHVSSELVEFVDQNYRTVRSPKGRAITGLSMGGHGAMFIALRHKEVFGAAGSMSGGVDIRPFPKNWNLSKRLGTIEEHPEQWEAMTAINNISQLKNGELALTIDCGLRDFFLGVNRDFHVALLKQGIDHDYTERPGAHDWTYWKNSIRFQMLYFNQFFTKARVPAPAN